MIQQVAAMGVAPHSGWAAVVALGRTPVGPRVLARSRIGLIEAGFPESTQPYHAVEALSVEEAAQRLKLYQAQAERMAHSAMQQLRVDLGGLGYRVGSAGIPGFLRPQGQLIEIDTKFSRPDSFSRW